MFGDDYFLTIKINDVERLITLAKMIDVNMTDSESDTLLHYAIKFDAFECMRVLLENKADANKANKYGETPLFLAAKMGKENYIKLLFRYGANVNARNNLGEIPLHLAALNGNISAIKLLIDQKSNVEQTNNNLQGVNHYAIRSGNPEVVKYILDRFGNTVKAIDGAGNSLLHYACKQNNTEIVKMLLDRGLSVHTRNNRKETPLFNAVRYSSMNVIYLLIKAGATFEIKNMLDENLLDIAKEERLDSYEYLDSLLYNHWYMDKKKKYPLHDAILTDNEQMVMRCLSSGFKPNKKDLFGKTAMDLAIEGKNENIIKMLKRA